MKSSFVEVYRSMDQIEAQQVHDILMQEGVPARLMGPNNPAAIGVGAVLFDWFITVPEGDLERARGLIVAFTAEVVSDDESELPWELREEGED